MMILMLLLVFFSVAKSDDATVCLKVPERGYFEKNLQFMTFQALASKTRKSMSLVEVNEIWIRERERFYDDVASTDNPYVIAWGTGLFLSCNLPSIIQCYECSWNVTRIDGTTSHRVNTVTFRKQILSLKDVAVVFGESLLNITCTYHNLQLSEKITVAIYGPVQIAKLKETGVVLNGVYMTDPKIEAIYLRACDLLYCAAIADRSDRSGLVLSIEYEAEDPLTKKLKTETLHIEGSHLPLNYSSLLRKLHNITGDMMEVRYDKLSKIEKLTLWCQEKMLTARDRMRIRSINELHVSKSFTAYLIYPDAFTFHFVNIDQRKVLYELVYFPHERIIVKTTRNPSQWERGSMQFSATFYDTRNLTKDFKHSWDNLGSSNDDSRRDPYNYPLNFPMVETDRIITYKVEACVKVACKDDTFFKRCINNLVSLVPCECAAYGDERLIVAPMTTDLMPLEHCRFIVNTCRHWIYKMSVTRGGFTDWYENSFPVGWSTPGGSYQMNITAFSQISGRLWTQTIMYEVVLPVHKMRINASLDMDLFLGEKILCSVEGSPKPDYVEWVLQSQTDSKYLSVKADILEVKALRLGIYTVKCRSKNVVRGVEYHRIHTYKFKVRIRGANTSNSYFYLIMTICSFLFFALMLFGAV